jgi:hypothetical protein
MVLGLGGRGSQDVVKSNVPDFDYTENKASPYCTHTEARLLDTVFAHYGDAGPPAGTTLTINIHWWTRPKSSPDGTTTTGLDNVSDDACPECRKIIDAAVAAGLKVVVCGHPEIGVPKET